MKDKLRVLFLPRWYPNRNDPMPGLFIQRQAEALTPYCQVAVVYVHPEPDCPNKFEVDFAEEEEVRVLRVYYRIPTTRVSILRNSLKLYRFYRAVFKAVKSIRQFSPDLIHAHILTRMGIIAFFFSRRWKIPYIISEHWSRYFPENNTYKGFLRHRITCFIVRRASLVIVVSEALKEAMLKWKISNSEYRVIPNVVGSDLFIPNFNAGHRNKKQILHVSCFEDKSKNISGLLRVVKNLSLKRSDFECILAGEGPDFGKILEYSKELEIPSSLVHFPGLLTNHHLVDAYQSADFMVLSSHYETFGTVVVESMLCGTPVVATRVGIVPEIINAKNGVAVAPGNEDELGNAIEWMLDHCHTFNKEQIRRSVLNKFEKKNIGLAMVEAYHKIVL